MKRKAVRSATLLVQKCTRFVRGAIIVRKYQSECVASSTWSISYQSRQEGDEAYGGRAMLIETYENDIEHTDLSTKPSNPLTPLCDDENVDYPPYCRLPTWTRFASLIYALPTLLVLSTFTSATPYMQAHFLRIDERQSIPDRFGNTGNEPGPVVSQQPPRTIAPSGTSTPATSTIASCTSPNLSKSDSVTTAFPTVDISTSSLPSAFPTNGPIGENLQRTSPASPFTPGIIAGTFVGGTILLCLLFGFVYFVYRRKRQRDVQEIPIRRSMLVSRLAYRILGSNRDASRSSSTASKYTAHSHSLGERSVGGEKPLHNTYVATTRSTYGSVHAWLDKSTTSRPRPAYVETSSKFLEIPRPLFADRDKSAVHSNELFWRPKRPKADAAPLGRLSGMGFGLAMGRLSEPRY